MDKISLYNNDRVIRIKTDDEDILMILASNISDYDEITVNSVRQIAKEAKNLWARYKKEEGIVDG